MIPSEVLKKYRLRLTMAENFPTQWLGDFFKEYIQNIADLSVDQQVKYLCGTAETFYAAGLLEGKIRAVKAIEKIILEYN